MAPLEFLYFQDKHLRSFVHHSYIIFATKLGDFLLSKPQNECVLSKVRAQVQTPTGCDLICEIYPLWGITFCYIKMATPFLYDS